MSRDFVHDLVKNALINDGWTITHDPFSISFGIRKVFADLGAEKLLAATKGDQKIAVEIKSFAGISLITELERALGQFVMYRIWLAKNEPDRVLYIALGEEAYRDLFEDISGRVLIEEQNLKLLVVNLAKEEIVSWI